MGLINIPDIQNLDAATPELWNSRFATLANVINGNIDANNLATGAVTAPKIGTDAVTTGKIMDANVTPAKWYNPYKFHAYRNAAWTGNTGKINLDTEVYDTNSNFDSTTNYRYTAPVSGFYHINAAASSQQATGTGYGCDVYKNGSTRVIAGQLDIATQTTSFTRTSVASGDVQLIAGDYLELFYTGGGSVTGVMGADSTYMSGHLISVT